MLALLLLLSEAYGSRSLFLLVLFYKRPSRSSLSELLWLLKCCWVGIFRVIAQLCFHSNLKPLQTPVPETLIGHLFWGGFVSITYRKGQQYMDCEMNLKNAHCIDVPSTWYVEKVSSEKQVGVTSSLTSTVFVKGKNVFYRFCSGFKPVTFGWWIECFPWPRSHHRHNRPIYLGNL